MRATDMQTTSIVLPRRTLELLRHVAAARANQQGRRISVSGVIADLLVQNEALLARGIAMNGKARP